MSDACNCPPPGAPAWVMTFADLMSLLMCFFVLLLSFAQMDAQKFKQVAGSMDRAFGVQDKIEAAGIPKGTSIIAREFSPGRPTPTVTKDIQQRTVDESRQTLDFSDAKVQETDAESELQTVTEALSEEIEQGIIQVETQGNRAVIRINEKASFPSGSASLRFSFLPAMGKISTVLEQTAGKIIIAGHTDNIPIKTKRYRSNWELSSSRAVSVAHQLMEDSLIEPSRLVIEGHGDAHPLVPNDSAPNRAKNRRVEIIIEQGDNDPEDEHILETRPSAPAPGQIDSGLSGPVTELPVTE